MSSSIHIWCWESVTILIRPVIIIIVVVIIVNIIIFNLFTKSFVIDIIINSLMLIMNIIVPDYPHLYCHLHAQYPHLCPSNLHYLRHSYHCNCHNHKAFFIKDVTLLSSNVSMYVCATEIRWHFFKIFNDNFATDNVHVLVFVVHATFLQCVSVHYTWHLSRFTV